MPVREALRMLQRDGLVDIQNHRGATVASVTWERIYEIVMVRMHLEVLATVEATPHHDAASLAEIENHLRAMDRAAMTDEGPAFSRANREFRTLLYEPAPYALLREEIQDLWDRMWRIRSRSLFDIRSDRLAAAQSEHWAIFSAVRDKDPRAAAACAEEHRAKTLEVWRQIGDNPVVGDEPGCGQT
jgi:DNA-binding GntR family transcriptional regulator